MRARHFIAILSGLLVLTGLVLALDLPPRLGIVFSAPEWGYTLFSLGADIAVVYLVVEFLLLREEGQRWKAVEGKAIERVRLQLWGVFHLVYSTLSPPIDLFSSKEDKMSRIREVAAHPDKLSMRVPAFEASSYFKSLARGVGELQLRYSSRLDPRLIDIMIDVENSLETMSSFIYAAHEFPETVGDVRELMTATL